MLARLKTAINDISDKLEEKHTILSMDFSNGVVQGYSKELLG